MIPAKIIDGLFTLLEKPLMKKTLLLTMMSMLLSSAWASNVGTLIVFNPGDTLSASDLNANFSALQVGVNDNDSRITTNESAVSGKQQRVSDSCTSGGAIRVINADGTVVCEQGTGATQVLITSTGEPRSMNCPNGGLLIESGLDLDGDTVLDVSEVQQSSYLCAISVGVNQGSPTPVDLPSSGSQAVRLADATVSSRGLSFYSFVAPGIGGGLYVIELVLTDSDLSLELYSDAAFTNLLLACDSVVGSAGNEFCVISAGLAPGVTYYLIVLENGGAPNTFDVSVSEFLF